MEKNFPTTEGNSLGLNTKDHWGSPRISRIIWGCLPILLPTFIFIQFNQFSGYINFLFMSWQITTVQWLKTIHLLFYSSGAWQGSILSGDSRKGFISLPFLASIGCLHPLACGLIIHLESQMYNIFSKSVFSELFHDSIFYSDLSASF